MAKTTALKKEEPVAKSSKKADLSLVSESILSKDFYDTYQVTCRFRDRVIGGIPASKKLISAWIEASTGHMDELTKKQIKEAENATELARIEASDKEQASWTVFASDKNGLYLETRQVKAGLRECFSLLRIFVEKLGSKQIFQHALTVTANPMGRIYLDREKPDGIIERPIHVETAQGPRNSLKRSDYCERPTIKFTIRVLTTDPRDKRHIGQKEIERVLALAEDNALGADRSQGFGTFDVIALRKVS